MVARPADYEELRTQISRNETQNSTSRNTLQSFLGLSPFGGDSLFGQLPLRQSSETAEQTTPEISTSLEPIRQTLLTTHTLLSTINQNTNFQNHLQNNNSSNSSSSSLTRKYFVGQWLDVRDTVNQWLEATVMIVDNHQERLFIHYNGWPTRWDEWIVFSSPRLAPFRTRTVNSTVNTSCPAPTNTVAHAPLTGPDDVRMLIPEMNRLIQLLQPMLNVATALCDENINIQSPVIDSEVRYAEGMPWDRNNQQDGLNSSNSPTDKMEDGKTHGLSDDENDKMSQSLPNEDNDAKLKQVLLEICPLFDRLGRAMTDLSPHLQKYAQPPTNTNNNSPTSPSNSTSHQNSPFPQIFPFGSLLSRPTRPPSPPAESFFRAPITNPARSNNIGQTSTNHLDIHIHAILTPFRLSSTQESSHENEGAGSSNTVTNQRTSTEDTSDSLLTPLLRSNQVSMSDFPVEDSSGVNPSLGNENNFLPPYIEDDFSSLRPDLNDNEYQSNQSSTEMRKADSMEDSRFHNFLEDQNEYDQNQSYSPHRRQVHHQYQHQQQNQSNNQNSSLKSSGDNNNNNNNMKIKSKSVLKSNNSSENDWRSSGRSREQSTSLLKKRSEPTSSSILSSNEYECNNLEHRKAPVSNSTRREMRGLMKAIDTASSSTSTTSSSSLDHSHSHQVYRERKEARILGDRFTDTSSKSVGKKISSSNSTSLTSSTSTMTTNLSSSPSSTVSSPLSFSQSQSQSHSLFSSSSSSTPQSSFLLRSDSSTQKKSDQNESLNRHSHQESVSLPEPQVQTRQANAENSFIQRVRRSLSFRQSQLQKQNPKQS
mmetsp:Transcript_5575/g.5737  ORF Transcript_5575/g.5737 Transcript_5575/m.5737 type:complete len:818 (+) Transcript_5575:141-2594(+)